MEQIIEKLATDYNITKKLSKEIIDTIVSEFATQIQSGEKLRLKGIGSFSLKTKNARKCRNPKTGDIINVPEKTVVKFTVSKTLKDSI